MEEIEPLSFLFAVYHILCKYIILFAKFWDILRGYRIILIGRCNDRLNGYLLETELRQMLYILGKIKIMMRICSL